MEVRRVEPPDDEELLEQWTSDGVEALLPDDHPWQIVVGVAEFAREEPPVPPARSWRRSCSPYSERCSW